MNEQDDKASLEADPTHDHDIAALMRQQLRDNITAEEAEEELEDSDMYFESSYDWEY